MTARVREFDDAAQAMFRSNRGVTRFGMSLGPYPERQGATMTSVIGTKTCFGHSQYVC
jgi:hypothetical protein